METLITKRDLEDLFRYYLELATNSLLQIELMDFFDYEKYNKAGFNSRKNYPRTFKTEYGKLNLVILGGFSKK